MKLFFVRSELTPFADQSSSVLQIVRNELLQRPLVEEVDSPDKADAVIIQEEKTTYKDFRYGKQLLKDPFISNYLPKLFTICTDDSATGLLRGLYTSIPKYRFKAELHKVVPFIQFTNPLVFENAEPVTPLYLAGWYGNTKSNQLRKDLVTTLQGNESFCMKTTQSWYNHNGDEQKAYVDVIKNSKFSLCPAGWAPPSPRIYESMALGRCPVIIADSFAPPEGPAWSEFALFYPQKKSLAQLPEFLRKHEGKYQELGAKAKQNWDQFFAGTLLQQYYANALLSLIQSTPPYSKEKEMKRWKSFSTLWNNRWTVPQRFVNKFKMLLLH